MHAGAGKMAEGLIIIIALAAAFFAFRQSGKWRQRARAAEEQNETNRKANEIKNRVAADPAFRERVRRRFDNP